MSIQDGMNYPHTKTSYIITAHWRFWSIAILYNIVSFVERTAGGGSRVFDIYLGKLWIMKFWYLIFSIILYKLISVVVRIGFLWHAHSTPNN